MTTRKKVLLTVSISLGSVLLLCVALLAVVFINGIVVGNTALSEQQRHLANLQQQVDGFTDGIASDWQETPIDDRVSWNRVQSIASHNSYAVAPNGIQHAVLAIASPGEPEKLAYSHPTLWQQLEQGIRSFELDLRVHDDGALRLTHVPVLANGSIAPDFRLALDELGLWSSSHPGHLPITLLIEFKSDYAFLDPSLADWSSGTLAAVDDAIRSGLADRLLEPSELNSAEWPAVGELRDRFVVIMHPNEGVEQSYAELSTAEHAMFVAHEGGGVGDEVSNGGVNDEGDDSESIGSTPTFIVHNTPDPDAISALVAAGAIVRTRADADLVTDPAERDRAFASGAQIISTDFPSPTTQQETGYTVAFEHDALSRVDPLRTPSAAELRLAAARAWVEQATPKQLAASVVMASLPTVDADQLHSLMAQTEIGGFILMGANMPGTESELQRITAALTIDPERPPIVAIDEEGGIVKQLPWDSYPGADTLRRADPAETTAAFAARAQLLKAAGANVNFGVVADITADTRSFIYWRTLGNDAASAAPRVAAAVTGERGLVASTLKHFPGHGAVPGDSHFAIPRTGLSLDAWRASDAVPFEAGIDAGAELLMFGHLVYESVTDTPASLAPEWYAIARDELGFTGVTITDDLSMLRASGVASYQDLAATSVAAIAAGADIALMVAGVTSIDLVQSVVDGIAAAVEQDTLPEERLRDAATRVMELRLQLAEQSAG